MLIIPPFNCLFVCLFVFCLLVCCVIRVIRCLLGGKHAHMYEQCPNDEASVHLVTCEVPQPNMGTVQEPQSRKRSVRGYHSRPPWAIFPKIN